MAVEKLKCLQVYECVQEQREENHFIYVDIVTSKGFSWRLNNLNGGMKA